MTPLLISLSRERIYIPDCPRKDIYECINFLTAPVDRRADTGNRAMANTASQKWQSQTTISNRQPCTAVHRKYHPTRIDSNRLLGP